jgi:hypothetical protein
VEFNGKSWCKGTICKKNRLDFNLNHLSASEVLKWEEISPLEIKNVNDFKPQKQINI